MISRLHRATRRSASSRLASSPSEPKTNSITQEGRRRHLASSSSNIKTTVVALSGGVDSSVAACQVLQDQQLNTVHAIHMSNWNTRDDVSLADKSCSSDQDWADAQAVAEHLKLSKIQRLSFEQEYWNHVWDPFVSRLSAVPSDAKPSVAATGTEDLAASNNTATSTSNAGSFNNAFVMGNPDIDCNRYVKFGALRDWCTRTYGHDGYHLATGHYARLYRPSEESSSMSNDNVKETLQEHSWLLDHGGDNSNPTLLLAAVDASKDQSYFLAGCGSDSLNNVLFPLGHLHKNQGPHSVRALAQRYQLPTAQKRDSVGICFVGTRQGGFRQFLQDYLPTPATECVEFVDIETNKCVGTTPKPDMACLWTVGQGAKIGGSSQRYFVAGHDSNHSNRVFVCAGTHHMALYSDVLAVSELHWVAGSAPAPLRLEGSMRVQCRVRHLQPLLDATIAYQNNQISVYFDHPVRGVTRGQFAAFYMGAVCLGGGPIARVGPTLLEQGREAYPAVACIAGGLALDVSFLSN